MADEYKPVGDPMGVWNHPMHDLQTRLEICAGSVEHQAAIAANMRRQRNDLRALLELWTHEGHLQTFEDRERFRKAARDLLDNPLGADGVPAVAEVEPLRRIEKFQEAERIRAMIRDSGAPLADGVPAGEKGGA